MSAALSRAAMATVGQALHERLLHTMAEVIPRQSRVALLDFPDHSNVGDSAIWLGELAILKQLESRICYVSSLATYRVERLRRALGRDGIVLLHGGGNFGDLWPRHQEHREQVLQDLGDYRVVQLPQSICFQDRERLARARRLLGRHERFTLMVRDQDSAGIAREQIGLAPMLCPDSAFALGDLDRPGPPERDVVWLSRDDHEGAPSTTGKEGVVREDWIQEPTTLLLRVAARLKALPDSFQRVRRQVFQSLAETRVNRGCALISSGRVLVTNRLHGLILSMLMGIPAFVTDTRQGKIDAFYRTWLADSMPPVLCGSEGEALDRARDLAATLATASTPNGGVPWN